MCVVSEPVAADGDAVLEGVDPPTDDELAAAADFFKALDDHAR